MGNAQATITKQTLAAYTDFMNSAMLTVTENNSASSIASNTLNLSFGATPSGQACSFTCSGCNLNVSQTANSTLDFKTVDTNNLTGDFKSSIDNKTQQFIDQDLKNSQGWFATAFSFQEAGASNSTEVANRISNYFQGNIYEMCKANITAANLGNISVCGDFTGTTINFNQDAATTALVSCVNNNTITAFMQDSVLNELYQKTDQKLASEQAGLSFTWIAIIAGIVLFVVILIFIMYYWFRKDKSNISSKSY